MSDNINYFYLYNKDTGEYCKKIEKKFLSGYIERYFATTTPVPNNFDASISKLYFSRDDSAWEIVNKEDVYVYDPDLFFFVDKKTMFPSEIQTLFPGGNFTYVPVPQNPPLPGENYIFTETRTWRKVIDNIGVTVYDVDHNGYLLGTRTISQKDVLRFREGLITVAPDPTIIVPVWNGAEWIESVSKEYMIDKISKEIDAKTDAMIDAGFEYDGEKFSLSLNAQISWVGADIHRDLLFANSTHIPIPTKDNKTYLLAKDKIDDFLSIALNKVNLSKVSGMTEKEKIKDMDVGSLKKYTDPR